MKLRSLLVGLCVSLCSTVFAANHHFHPQATNSDKKTAEKTVGWADACEIEVINESHADILVTGTFEDGTSLAPFTIYAYEYLPSYIDLFYYDFCHSGMYVHIVTLRNGYPIYSRYTHAGRTIHVFSPYADQLKAEVSAK
jgi:hypothetical protein